MPSDPVVQAALALAQAGTEPTTKRARGNEGPVATVGGGSSSSSAEGALLTKLLRSHLLQSNTVQDASNAVNLVLLVKAEEDKKHLHQMLDLWHGKQREIALTPEQRRRGEQAKDHEWGHRRVFLCKMVMDRLAMQHTDGPIKQATEAVLGFSETLELYLANFSPEHATPKEGRPWKLKISFSPLVTDAWRAPWTALCQELCRARNLPWLMEPMRAPQSQLVKELWDELKSRPNA